MKLVRVCRSVRARVRTRVCEELHTCMRARASYRLFLTCCERATPRCKRARRYGRIQGLYRDPAWAPAKEDVRCFHEGHLQFAMHDEDDGLALDKGHIKCLVKNSRALPSSSVLTEDISSSVEASKSIDACIDVSDIIIQSHGRGCAVCCNVV